MRNHNDVIDLWPSTIEFANDTGKTIGQVWKWRQRGFIPPGSWSDVVDAANKRNFKVDFNLLSLLSRRKK